MSCKLAIVVSHPIQYYCPLYRLISSDPRFDLLVLYLSDSGAQTYVDQGFDAEVKWDVPLLVGYRHEVARPGLKLEEHGFFGKASIEILRSLERFSPDAIMLYGYSSLMNWQAIHWATRNGIKVIYHSDSNVRGEPLRARHIVKQFVVRQFFKRVSYFLATSRANSDYLMKYGAPTDRLIPVPFAIESSRFRPAKGVKRFIDFVWAGKFIARKAPKDFLYGIELASKIVGRKIRARMIGSGVEFDECVRIARELNIAEVEMTGFKNQKEIPLLLSEGRVFVFTSREEPFGLAVSEACAAGLAIISSDKPGCVGENDIAQPGVNSLIYHSGDIGALSRHMADLFLNPDKINEMASKSLDISASNGYDKVVEGIYMACTATLGSQERNAGI